MGPDAMILAFWMLSFKPTFSLSCLPFIKRLFSFLLSAISVVSSAYLMLLVFLPAVLIPACASSSLAFLMIYSLWSPRVCSPWNSPDQNTGVGSLSLLQGIFPTQESNPGLPYCRRILYQLSHKGSPRIMEWVAYLFSSGSFWLRNRTRVSCIAGIFFTNWAIRDITWNARLDVSQAGIKTATRNINNLRYADDTTPMAESEEELKEENVKAGWKLNIQNTKIMASGPITS